MSSKKSPQEKAAEQLTGRYQNLYNQIAGSDFYNAFESGPKYGAEDMMSAADNLLEARRQETMRVGGDLANQAQSATAQRLASQGLTSGSFANNQIGRARSDAGRNVLNNLNQLDIARLGQQLDILNQANKDQYAWTQADVASKSGQLAALQGALAGQSPLLSMYDDTTWWDDVMEGLKLGGGIAGSILKIPGVL